MTDYYIAFLSGLGGFIGAFVVLTIEQAWLTHNKSKAKLNIKNALIREIDISITNIQHTLKLINEKSLAETGLYNVHATWLQQYEISCIDLRRQDDVAIFLVIKSIYEDIRVLESFISYINSVLARPITFETPVNAINRQQVAVISNLTELNMYLLNLQDLLKKPPRSTVTHVNNEYMTKLLWLVFSFAILLLLCI